MAEINNVDAQMRQWDADLWQGMKDWESDPPPISDVVVAQTRNEMRLFWIFSTGWNVIALPLGYLSWDEFSRLGNTPAILGLLFPLFGFWLLGRAIFSTFRIAKFGQIALRMDPSPGSIGGELGGVIDIPLPFRREQIFMISLTTLRERPRRGEDEGWREILWQQSGRAFATPARTGTTVAFRFAVPAHLPPSYSGPGIQHRWEVRLTADLPGVDLDDTFVVPVMATPSPVASTITVPLAPDAAPVPSTLASGVRIDRQGQHLFLVYSPRRQLKLALSYCLAGGWFILISGLIISGRPLIGLLALPVMLLGLFVFLIGLYNCGDSLEVGAGGGCLRVRRKFIGVTVYSKVVLASSLRSFQAVRLGTVGVTKAKLLFKVVAHLGNGDKIAVGDGITGLENAETIADLLAQNLNVRREATQFLRSMHN